MQDCFIAAYSIQRTINLIVARSLQTPLLTSHIKTPFISISCPCSHIYLTVLMLWLSQSICWLVPTLSACSLGFLQSWLLNTTSHRVLISFRFQTSSQEQFIFLPGDFIETFLECWYKLFYSKTLVWSCIKLTVAKIL